MGTLFFAGADVPGVWGLLLAQGGFGGGAQPALPVLLYLALAVLAVLGAWLAGRALLDGRARAWLIREADRGGAGGPRAVVVVSLSESRRLPGAKLRGAMRSLGL